MKRLCLIPLLLIAATVPLRAALMETYSFNGLSKEIPNGLETGVSDTHTIPSAIDVISSITVDLKIVGGFNGDLYCYLRHDSGFSVLLNRPGRTATDSSGYDDSGFQVTFSDGAGNGDIHLYRNVVMPMSPLTGTWRPDGRDVNPALVTDGSARTALLSSFNGSSASGEWTLFIADLQDDDGAAAVLDSWGMQITAVPEPVTAALGVFGAIALLMSTLRLRSNRQKS